MEESLSMPELIATLDAQQQQDYDNKKFTAALKGIDLDQQNNAGKEKIDEIKARIAKRSAAGGIVPRAGEKRIELGMGYSLDYEAI